MSTTSQEDKASPTLFPVALRKLCPEAIDLARQLNDIIDMLAKTNGYATLTIDVSNGVPTFLKVQRSFKLSTER